MPKHRSPFQLFLILLIIVVAFFILYGVGAMQPVIAAGQAVFQPVLGAFSWVGNRVDGWFDFLGSIGEMDEKNQELQTRVDQLLSDNTKLKEMLRENELLRQEVGFQYEHRYDTVPAAVIGRSTDPGLQTVEVNVGENRGIVKDMPVILGDGLLVGRVTVVGFNSATVLLLSDRQSVVNAIVQDTRASGIVRGKHGLELLMDSIPQNEGISAGQMVITSGLGGGFPAGLLIGEIKEVQESSNELFKEARLLPVVNFDRLEIVFVLTGTH